MSIPYLYPDNKIIIAGQYPMDAAHIHGGVEASVYCLAQELAKKYNVPVFDVPRFDVPA